MIIYVSSYQLHYFGISPLFEFVLNYIFKEFNILIDWNLTVKCLNKI